MMYGHHLKKTSCYVKLQDFLNSPITYTPDRVPVPGYRGALVPQYRGTEGMWGYGPGGWIERNFIGAVVPSFQGSLLCWFLQKPVCLNQSQN
jgi:hypothetical protein